MGTGPPLPRATTSAGGQRRSLLLVMAAAVFVWIAAGLLRAPGIARDYLAAMERPKQVSGVSTGLGLAIPPFWSVQVRGTVTESSGASYRSAMILWVEPVTGFVLTVGAG